MGRPAIHIEPGTKFGKLTVLEKAHANRSGQWFLCTCECGVTIVAISARLRSGRVRSCGCLRSETSAALNMRHGHAGNGKATRTYVSWLRMIERTTNKKHKFFKYYGGRGITVCERWRTFDNFLTDMGERPEGTSIDRYPNNNGNYEPGNCRWATAKEQIANRRRYS